jgi:hypothetical protein
MHIHVLSGFISEIFDISEQHCFIPTSLGNHWGQYQDQAEMKVSKLIKHQYQAGKEVLNTMHNRYVKRETLLQHPQY